jgi:hypothetical protein
MRADDPDHAVFPTPALERARRELEAALREADLRVGPPLVLRHAWQDAGVAPPWQVQVMLAAPPSPPLDPAPRPLLVRARFGEGVVEVQPGDAWRVTVEAELIFPHAWCTVADMEGALARRYTPLGLVLETWEAEDEPARDVVWTLSTWSGRTGSAGGAARVVAGLAAEGMLARLPGIVAPR